MSTVNTSNARSSTSNLEGSRLTDFLPVSFESLSNTVTSNLSNTVSTTASMLFSPLTHRAVKGDTVALLSELAPQLMDQRRIQQYTNSSNRQSKESPNQISASQEDYPNRISIKNTELLLLDAEIPESKAPLSLFQGYKATFLEAEVAKKKGKPHKRKSRGLLTDGCFTPDATSDTASVDYEIKPLNQLIADRDRVVKENDKLHLQESRAIAEIKKIEMDIIELTARKINLETDLTKYSSRKIELAEQLEDLNERITDLVQMNGFTEKKTRSIKGKKMTKPKYEPGTCIKVLEGHNDMIICLDFDKPDEKLVTSSMDKTLRLWDLSSYRCLGILDGHEGIVNCMQLVGSHLVTGSSDNTIRQWDTSKSVLPNEPVTDLMGKLNFHSELSTENNESSLIGDNCFLATLVGHSGSVTCLHYDGSCLVTGSSDKTMRQWDLETGQCILTMDILWAMSSSKAERRQTGFLLDSYLFDQGDFVGALQFRYDGLASGTEDGAIRIITSLQFDSNKIICSANTNDIKMYNRISFQHSSLGEHRSPVQCIKYKDSILSSGGLDNVIKIWAL
ncbi:10489_t:CDS:10 [Diversispora eburnea]|uniref:10489_t:CDS:1 n=1 Tax=Diversispora eburnea TaxID=1213867 RepID=A0A9N8VRN5_9GLOM|nr:10489_t:CDS:10 [Diversispora eburnea]